MGAYSLEPVGSSFLTCLLKLFELIQVPTVTLKHNLNCFCTINWLIQVQKIKILKLICVKKAFFQDLLYWESAGIHCYLFIGGIWGGGLKFSTNLK